MDAFFAAIESQRHPELKGLPLVVGGRGDPSQRGVVSTASYEARRYGVHSAMPLRTAFRLCPDCIFLPVDMETYAEVSGHVHAVLRRFSKQVERAGLDEAFLDLSHCAGLPEKIGRAIKQAVLDETALTCSVGIAPNKLLAKLASDLDKPDGLTVITRDDIPRRIWPLPARRLWGVGPRTEGRLAELGVRTIGELARLPLEVLMRRFGQAHGRYLFESARGIDRSPVSPHRVRKSLGREVTFQQDLVSRTQVEAALHRLAEEVAAELKERGFRGRTVVLKLRYADFETFTRQSTLPQATAEAAELAQATVALAARLPLSKKTRLLGLRVTGLEPAASENEP